MGFIADLVKDATVGRPPLSRGPSSWSEVFGTRVEDEEALFRQLNARKTSSVTSSDASMKRLITALRSRAPGGWTDDRWEQSRHFVGIAYVAVHRKCEMLAQAEFQVFRKDTNHPDGKRPVDEKDPPQGGRAVRPYDLIRLLEKPNKQDSFGKMMYRWNQQKDLTGSALTIMVPNRLGTPMELYPMPTAVMVPQAVTSPEYPEGYYRVQPLYPYGPFSSWPTPNTSVGAPVPGQWVLKFSYPHPLLRYEGYSPLTALRLHLDEIEAMDRSRWYSMKRTVNPSAVLNMEGVEGMQPLSGEELDRLKAEFENSQQGVENVGSLLVPPPGATLEPWGTKPVEMDYQAGWDQLVSFALGGFGITKPAAGMIDNSSYSTLFATLKQLHLLTLAPACNDIASELTKHLAPFFGDDLIIEVRCQRIDDHDVKASKLDKLIQARAITKNELRKELDLPLTEEPWGDEIAGTEVPSAADPTAPGLGVGEPSFPGAENGLGAGVAGGGQTDTAPGGEVTLMEEPKEVADSRPKPKKQGRHSLGPRKSLPERIVVRPTVLGKSLYERVREASRNGHAN